MGEGRQGSVGSADGKRPEGIAESFETAKNEFGLDHNETRSWHGWHRHVSLVMLAFAMVVAIRHQANAATPKKTKRYAAVDHKASSGGRSRKSAWSLWRRAHQAAAQTSHMKQKLQL